MGGYGRARGGRTLRDTRHFWNIHQTWAHFVTPAVSIAFGVILVFWHGSKTLIDAALSALGWAVCFYVVAWIGSFLINYVFISPSALHEEQRQRADSAETRQAALQTELNEARSTLASERQRTGWLATLEAENARLHKQLEVPKLAPNIRQFCFAEAELVPLKIMLDKAALVAAGQFQFNTPLLAYVVISNEHRVSSTATYTLRIVDRSRTEPAAREEPVADLRKYPLIDLTMPIEFAQPRSGWLHFHVKMKSREDLIGARLILSVTDGTGTTSTAEKEIS